MSPIGSVPRGHVMIPKDTSRTLSLVASYHVIACPIVAADEVSVSAGRQVLEQCLWTQKTALVFHTAASTVPYARALRAG